MEKKIAVGIVGYGNLGRGAEAAVLQAPDMELKGIFSRRSLPPTEQKTPVYSLKEVASFTDKIDVMLLCGGSATDLQQQGPELAALFHTVDSFDTHAHIPQYFEVMDKTAKEAGKVAAISVGWDPGLFSLQRLLSTAVLPEGDTHTFWGKGVSQGHSDAIRRIPGVKNAKQYTIPKSGCLEDVRAGKSVSPDATQTHLRDCYVVVEEGADQAAIEKAIKTMPNYFAGYETTVTFLSEMDFLAQHGGIPHGGHVFRQGRTGQEQHVMELALKLDSNPAFTASVLTAYARGVYRMQQHGYKGAVTVFDIPFAWLSVMTPKEQRKHLL